LWVIESVYVRKQILRFGGIVFDFLAELADKDAQVFDLFAEVSPPYRSKKFGEGHRLTGATHQEVQNIEFLGG
jgi:hypothetical protein